MTPKSDMNIYDDAWQVAKFQALVAAGATIPGYFVTVYMIDYVGRVKIQAAGFFFMAVSLFTIAKVNKGGWGSNPAHVHGEAFSSQPNEMVHTNTQPAAKKRTRGAFIAGVFSMQGFGILLSSLVTMSVCSAFNDFAHNLKSPVQLAPSEKIAPVPPEADVAWRLILMIGAIPASMTYYWRMKMPETARLSLFQNHAFKGEMRKKGHMNLYDDAWQAAKFQALIAACATIPGYFVTVYLIDYVGRVKIQAAGFFFMAVSLFTIAKANTGGWDSDPGTWFRATCHGIAGAFGKVGAIVGTVGLLWVTHDSPNGHEVSDVLMAMGGVCVLGFFVTYFFTRETMGRSLEENENVDEFTGVCFVRFWPNKV
ncbi:probable inorganic phosphate transporter 1-9 [Tanacetum coccineum]